LRESRKKGLTEMTLAAFIWGSVPIFAIWCNLPSPIFVLFRVVFAFPLVLWYAVKKIGIKEVLVIKPAKFLILSGISLALNWIFLFWAIQYTSVANAVILYYSGPIVTIILSVIILKERFTKNIAVSVGLSTIGIVIIFAPKLQLSSVSRTGIIGLIFGLLSGILYGLLGIFSKLSIADHPPIKTTVYQIFISLLFTLPFAFFMKYTLNLKIISLLIVTGIIHTATALFLWYDSLRYISVITASVLSYLDPIFAIALSFLILRQVPTLFQITGGILIGIAGIKSSCESMKNA